MNILVVDDERLPLEYLIRVIKQVLTDVNVTGFRKPSEALEYAKSNHVDLAFLDIELGGMNGLQLAKKLKDIYGRVDIIFTTGNSQYTANEYVKDAGGYLLKTVTAEAVIEAMDYLQNPTGPAPKKRIRIQTFGDFEVYVYCRQFAGFIKLIATFNRRI